MMGSDAARTCCTTVYHGAELFEKLCDCGKTETTSDSPQERRAAERMLSLARQVENSEGRCTPEALYQIGIWALLDEAGGETKNIRVDTLIAAAARAGHPAARFVLAKAVLDRVWWADCELASIAKDGDAVFLAQQWLEDLAAQGFCDAKVERASRLWREGNEQQALTELEALAPSYPEARIRQGLFLLALDPDKAMRLIDEGEWDLSTETSLKRLENALLNFST